MATSSGQINCYRFQLQNDLHSSPVVHIYVHTSRTITSGNYLTLGISDHLKTKDSLAFVNTYVTDRLQNLGAQLIRHQLSRFHNDVLTGKATVGDEAPSYIKVSNSVNARKVINDLFTHHEMSAGNRSDIEDSLRELERSEQFSTQRTDSISIAQKDVIENVVSPYIEDIKAAAPDSETAKDWIKCTARLTVLDPNIARDYLPELLGIACKSGNGKSADFYDSLFAVARIYASMGDLEGALQQLGATLPSGTIIEKTILDLFN